MLRRMTTRTFGGLLMAILPMAGCSTPDSHAKVQHESPSTVVALAGTDFKTVTLTARAFERTDVQTGEVTMSQERQRKVVPYSSIIYDPRGGTWVYTSPEPRTFVRAPIVIDRIDGDHVYLIEGPAVGTVVASRGVAELYGTEFPVGH